MEEEIPKNYSIAQKRALFFRFVDFNDPNFGDELKAKVSTCAAAGGCRCWGRVGIRGWTLSCQALGVLQEVGVQVAEGQSSQPVMVSSALF